MVFLPDPNTSLLRRIQQLEKSLEASVNQPLANTQAILMGASKGQTASIIEEAIHSGLRHFGENRVQQATVKWPQIKERHSETTLHLIGPLQSNKAKEAVALFDVIQTLDRPSLATALAHAMEKAQRDIPCFIQVNTGEETQKAGILPAKADHFIRDCRKLGLRIEGLMCIPPAGLPPAPHFALLRKIAHAHGIAQLSMGMSEDFQTALRMGSTCVRIGRALFGERPSS